MTTLIGPSVLDPSLFIDEAKVRRKSAVLQELVTRAHRAGAVRDPEVLREALLVRERLFRTAIGKGVAVPNARSIAVLEPRIVIARSRRGFDWETTDSVPVQLVLLMLSPGDVSEDAHLEFVSRATTVARLQRNRSRLLEADDFVGVADVFAERAE